MRWAKSGQTGWPNCKTQSCFEYIFSGEKIYALSLRTAELRAKGFVP